MGPGLRNIAGLTEAFDPLVSSPPPGKGRSARSVAAAWARGRTTAPPRAHARQLRGRTYLTVSVCVSVGRSVGRRAPPAGAADHWRGRTLLKQVCLHTRDTPQVHGSRRDSSATAERDDVSWLGGWPVPGRVAEARLGRFPLDAAFVCSAA